MSAWLSVARDPLFEFSSTDELLRSSDVYSVDVRLKSDPARLAWVAGIYAQKRNEDLQRQHFGPFSSDYETERYAVYGELTFELADNLNLTSGLRYEHFEDKYNDAKNKKEARDAAQEAFDEAADALWERLRIESERRVPIAGMGLVGDYVTLAAVFVVVALSIVIIVRQR